MLSLLSETREEVSAKCARIRREAVEATILDFAAILMVTTAVMTQFLESLIAAA